MTASQGPLGGQSGRIHFSLAFVDRRNYHRGFGNRPPDKVLDLSAKTLVQPVNESLTIFAYPIKEAGDGTQPVITLILATESVVARASRKQPQRTSAYDMLY